jgi:ParG
MTGKKISFGGRPSTKILPEQSDEWVKNRELPEKEKMKRLTIDVTESLHRAIKSECAMRGTKIADEVRELLISKYVKS